MAQVTIRAKRSVILHDPTSGFPRTIVQGHVFAADDPLVKAFPDEFSAFREVPIEQATAAPGERRGDTTR